MIIDQKYQRLKRLLSSFDSVVIAFSGGVDSTFLVKVAFEVLGKNVVAVTAMSSTYPERELNDAKILAGKIGVKHFLIDSEELAIEGFAQNPVNRCYYCKHELFTKLSTIAQKMGSQNILDGSNYDDIGDYRPGMTAAEELNIISPLKEVQLSKNEIRELSKRLGLSTWNKPAFACLSSRFPYGQKITKEKLKMVERAEQYLLNKGFTQVRVRHHGEIARIEVSKEERIKFFNLGILEEIGSEFKNIGFTYSTFDILGYRSGSMNETLVKE